MGIGGHCSPGLLGWRTGFDLGDSPSSYESEDDP